HRGRQRWKLNRKISRIGDVAEEFWRVRSGRGETPRCPTCSDQKENRKTAQDEQRCRQASELAWNLQQPPAYRYQSEQEHGENRQKPAVCQGEAEREKIEHQDERPKNNCKR